METSQQLNRNQRKTFTVGLSAPSSRCYALNTFQIAAGQDCSRVIPQHYNSYVHASEHLLLHSELEMMSSTALRAPQTKCYSPFSIEVEAEMSAMDIWPDKVMWHFSIWVSLIFKDVFGSERWGVLQDDTSVPFLGWHMPWTDLDILILIPFAHVCAGTHVPDICNSFHVGYNSRLNTV